MNPWRAAVLLLLLAAVEPAAADVRVDVSADPALPAQNLLKNPGFEAGGEMPDGWGISSGMPELFRFRRQATGGRQGACARVDGLSSRMSGYLAQFVPVQPATRYRAGAWLRLRGGHCLIWLLSYVAGRRWDVYIHKASWGGNPLVPNFIPLEFTDSPPPDQWVWVGQEFTTESGQTNLNFHVGSYFERGSMDFDDAFLGLARTTLRVKVAGEALRSVTVQDDGGKEWLATGPLPEQTTSFEREMKEMPTSARYQVIVRTIAGQEVRRWYPE